MLRQTQLSQGAAAARNIFSTTFGMQDAEVRMSLNMSIFPDQMTGFDTLD